MNALSVVPLLLFSAATAFSQLTWESREVSLKASYSDKRIVATFKFKNDGADPVKIVSVRSLCDCTTTALEKTEYAHGESGEIVATFNVGDRTGEQQKSVTVQTDIANSKPVVLTLKVKIPSLVEIVPALLFWKAGEERVPKTITITVPNHSPVKVTGIESSSPEIVTEMTPTANANEYSVKVTPPISEKPLLATITLKTESALPLSRTFSAYVVVR